MREIRLNSNSLVYVGSIIFDRESTVLTIPAFEKNSGNFKTLSVNLGDCEPEEIPEDLAEIILPYKLSENSPRYSTIVVENEDIEWIVLELSTSGYITVYDTMKVAKITSAPTLTTAAFIRRNFLNGL